MGDNNDKKSKWVDSIQGGGEEETQEASQQKDPRCHIWLDTLPSKTGILLAALLANIMTEGLTPDQQNILGNFISSVGSLISYKASVSDENNI